MNNLQTNYLTNWSVNCITNKSGVNKLQKVVLVDVKLNKSFSWDLPYCNLSVVTFNIVDSQVFLKSVWFDCWPIEAWSSFNFDPPAFGFSALRFRPNAMIVLPFNFKIPWEKLSTVSYKNWSVKNRFKMANQL